MNGSNRAGGAAVGGPGLRFAAVFGASRRRAHIGAFRGNCINGEAEIEFAPVAVFAGLIVVLGAGGAWWALRGGPSAGAGPAVATAAPPLPTGKLAELKSHLAQVRYLLPDATAKAGTTVQATVFWSGPAPRRSTTATPSR